MVSTDFALGLIAGEGSFTLNKRTYPSKNKPYCYPTFQLCMNVDEKYLVAEVREVFGGVGSISIHEYEYKDSTVRWQIQSKEDVVKFCDIVDSHDDGPWLASKKREAYQTWKKMVGIYSNGPCNDRGRVEMAELARDEKLNVGAGGSDANWDSFIEWYGENRNVYPDSERNTGTQ